jgi:hypothetical protein
VAGNDTPTISSVIFGINRMLGQTSFFAIQGSNLAPGMTVNISAQSSAKQTWQGTILKQLPSGSWLAQVNFTGTANADDSPSGDVDQLQVTVTSGTNTTPAVQVTADVYSAAD